MLARKRRLRSVKRKEIFGRTNDLRHFLAETVLLALSSCLDLLELLESDYKCSTKKKKKKKLISYVQMLHPRFLQSFESG